MGKERKEAAQTHKVRILAAAYQDIDEITDFIATEKQQPLNAVKVARTIFLTIDRIALNPFAFKECEEIPTRTKMYRKAVSLTWLIIYRVTAIEIMILGIVHKSRKASRIRRLKKLK